MFHGLALRSQTVRVVVAVSFRVCPKVGRRRFACRLTGKHIPNVLGAASWCPSTGAFSGRRDGGELEGGRRTEMRRKKCCFIPIFLYGATTVDCNSMLFSGFIRRKTEGRAGEGHRNPQRWSGQSPSCPLNTQHNPNPTLPRPLNPALKCD